MIAGDLIYGQLSVATGGRLRGSIQTHGDDGAGHAELRSAKVIGINGSADPAAERRSHTP